MTRIRTLTVSRLYREWGEPHRKRECVVPGIPVQREMALNARHCIGTEDSRCYKRGNYHARASQLRE
jgi:hypothetical protein